MYRPLFAVALLLPTAASAQSDPQPAPRQMPTYQDDDAQWRGGTSESYGTADLHHHVDQTPPPPPVPEGYGYDPYGAGTRQSGSGRGARNGSGARQGSGSTQGSGSGQDSGSGSGPQPAPADGWQTPKPYARSDQVDQGTPDDAAHRADRARTADLNRRPWRGYNAPAHSATADNPYAAEHARYQAALAAHAQDMQRYQYDQEEYQKRIAAWHRQTDACAQGYTYACGGGPD
ncbi:hypothetical protein [Sphingomonas oryzagri]|uniref:Uncharacterized protein n=1 Tax=Sphingomonas oryzagri TaxID=3042314 RepID=A0ABT6MW75_9SPHN|nr:hypothetical protein [Sphingomonas oryzagri]MDH7637239.1 hypothetical protein [Sphingomonas oryzagri]